MALCEGLNISCIYKLVKDLWRSRRCLKDIEGFDHSVVNSTLGACGDLPADQEGPCLAYSIWQCGQNKVHSYPIFSGQKLNIILWFYVAYISCLSTLVRNSAMLCLSWSSIF